MKHEWQQAEPSNKPKPLLLLNFTFFHRLGRLERVFSLPFKFPHCFGVHCGYLAPTLTLKTREKDKTCYETTESVRQPRSANLHLHFAALGIRARKFGFSSLSARSCVNIDLHGRRQKVKFYASLLPSLIHLIMQINIDLYGGLFVQSSTMRWQFGYGCSLTSVYTVVISRLQVEARLKNYYLRFMIFPMTAALIPNHGRNFIVSAIKWFFENAKLSQHRKVY